MPEENEEIEIDLLDLPKLLLKHLRLVIALPVACALCVAAYAWVVMPNEYTASISMYVLSKSSSDDTISNTDLTASQMITNDVSELIQSNRISTETATSLGLETLDDYDVKVTSSTDTRVITLDVTGTSASEVANVANGIAAATSEVAQEIMDVQSVNIIDQAIEPAEPSGPNRILYTLVAFVVGLCMAVAAVAIMEMADTRVRNPEQIESLIDVPLVGRIPVIK